MNLNELRNKYENAHSAYLRHKNTNKTNNIEAEFIPEVLEVLKKQFTEATIITVPDCLLNYIGIDFIISKGNRLITIDLKVCQHCHNNEVMIDAYKHQGNNWYNALNDKVNDLFVFVNNENIIIVPTKEIRKLIPAEENCFFLSRDLYHTTKKSVVDVSNCKKVVLKRI